MRGASQGRWLPLISSCSTGTKEYRCSWTRSKLVEQGIAQREGADRPVKSKVVDRDSETASVCGRVQIERPQHACGGEPAQAPPPPREQQQQQPFTEIHTHVQNESSNPRGHTSAGSRGRSPRCGYSNPRGPTHPSHGAEPKVGWSVHPATRVDKYAENSQILRIIRIGIILSIIRPYYAYLYRPIHRG